MNQTFSNSAEFIAQLQNIEQQINDKQLQEAALQLNQLGKTALHDPRLFVLGSRLAEAAGNFEGMLQAAQKAHQLAPEWPNASMRLARVLAGRDEADEAMSLVEDALAQAASQATSSARDTELLCQAATVAQRLNRHPQALQWWRKAEHINPEDFGIRHQIARSLIHCNDAESAVGILSSLLAQLPNHPGLLSDRLRARLNTQQYEQAIQDGQALLALDPFNEEYRFLMDLALSITPKTLPAAVITNLFDGYGVRMDHHLADPLQSILSADVADSILQWYPDRNVDVLDLGCGTGTLGASLGSLSGALIGVDLSQEMADKAIAQKVYDRIHRVNILDALQATPSDHYDVITALNVLTYLGDLTTVIPNAHRILAAGGRLVFSYLTCADDKAGYTLQNYRYTHQTDYVQELLEKTGFGEIHNEARTMCLVDGEPVQGFLVTARKPVTTT